MIIKRIEKEDNIKIIHESSNILASTFDKATNDLTIIFKNGGQYKYSNVKKTDYLQFEMAESVGKALNQYIKPYPFSKLEDVDTKIILEEIEKVQNAAIEGMTELVVKQMKNIVDFYAEYKVIEDFQIDDLGNIINKYKDIKFPKKIEKDGK